MPAPDTDQPAVHTEGRLPGGQHRQAWTPPAPVGVVVLVHGLHEHGGRYAPVAERLTRAGYTVHTVDHPGHGRSPGTRGDIRSMAVTVGGVAALVREAADAAPGLPVFVYGHSLGGLIALQYLTGRPDARVRGAVISAPALASGAAAGRVQRLLAPLVARVLPELGVLRLDPDAVSRDPAVVAAYLGDPLNHTGKVRARTGHEMVVAGDAMPGRLARLTVPVLVLHGGADRLVPPSASEVVTERAGSADVTRTVYPGLYHEPHNEPEREQVLDDVVAWLDAHRG